MTFSIGDKTGEPAYTFGMFYAKLKTLGTNQRAKTHMYPYVTCAIGLVSIYFWSKKTNVVLVLRNFAHAILQLKS